MTGKHKMVIMAFTLLFGLMLNACSEGDDNTNTTSNQWDQMSWDQGKWG